MKKNDFAVSVSIILLMMFSIPLFGGDNINLNLDVCQYRFNPDSSLVEIYYALAGKAEQGKTAGPYLLELQITTGENTIVNNLWQIQAEQGVPADSAAQGVIVDVLRYLLPPGNYNFKLIAKNIAHPEKIDSVQVTNFSVRELSTKNIEMSDIELAQYITTADPNNKTNFDKNNFSVTPNPLKVYSKENPDVYYYLELYNLFDNYQTNYFVIKRSIYDSNGLPVTPLPVYKKKKRIRGSDAIEVGMFNISQLPSGKYYLVFAPLDSNQKEIMTVTTHFYVHNPDITIVDRSTLPIEAQMAGSEIALLSDSDLDMYVGATRYLVSETEKRLIDNLETPQAKRIFLYRYWRDRDSNKATPTLESFRELMRRIQFVNANFGQIKKQGWQTDRGRVFIVYGKPSEIQYYSNVSDFKEFQAWSYDDIERGVVFIFGVIGSFGDLQLIHSTKTGEVYNEFWFDLLKVTEGRTGISDLGPGIDQRQALRDVFRKHNLELPRYLR